MQTFVLLYATPCPGFDIEKKVREQTREMLLKEIDIVYSLSYLFLFAYIQQSFQNLSIS